jgi:spore germination cell wall hydrolase CwlJ-like protein
MVRFLVSDFGISWVESRDGHELVKLEGAEAIQELQRMAERLRTPQHAAAATDSPALEASRSLKPTESLSSPLA